MTGTLFVPSDPLGPARHADPAVLLGKARGRVSPIPIAGHDICAHRQRMSGEIIPEFQVVTVGWGNTGDPKKRIRATAAVVSSAPRAWSGNTRGCRHNHAHLE